jgi:hypothetical protein
METGQRRRMGGEMEKEKGNQKIASLSRNF